MNADSDNVIPAKAGIQGLPVTGRTENTEPWNHWENQGVRTKGSVLGNKY